MLKISGRRDVSTGTCHFSEGILPSLKVFDDNEVFKFQIVVLQVISKIKEE